MSERDTTSENRSCWNTARERNRLKARFLIRQRVLQGTVPSEQEPTAFSREEVQDVLRRIVNGDRSFFSLTSLESRVELLSTPFPTEYLSEDEETLLGQDKILSWFGSEGAQRVRQFQQEWSTISFLEYSAWLQRYAIVGCLLLGGINPCRQSWRAEACDSFNEETIDEELSLVGQAVLKRLLRNVPLTLQTYMFKRVVDMRLNGFSLDDPGAEECQVCCRQLSRRSRLCFGDLCGHVFCECCFWKHLLQEFEQRDGDVVACPLCGSTLEVDPDRRNITHLSPSERCQASLQKFMSLPLTAKELKRISKKKRPPSNRDCIQSTWSKAVQPSLGLSQTVRSEKFLAYVERGSYHFVTGCLEAGVDVSLTNDYGQTALFLAAWRGHTRVIRLLLEYGSDPCTCANGGLSVLQVASNEAIKAILKQYGADCCVLGATPASFELPTTSTPTRTVLIPSHLDHPGAGSFLVDGGLSQVAIDQLIDLHKTLPVAESARKKDVPCSTRSYYCDTPQVIVRALESIISRTLDSLKEAPVVLVQMRFLSYEEAGATLAPHVDLCRALPYPSTLRSTHSFLLYLTECQEGGETSLLQDLGSRDALAVVEPQPGRLLVFPHACPHRGEKVVDVPKLLLRGEVWLPQYQC